MPQVQLSALASITILIFAACQAPSSVTAFVGVDVIPMDRERVLHDQTVIVRDGKVTGIGPSDQVELPAGTRRIEGEGRYLLPGFCDMHDHLPKPEDPILPADHIVLQLAGGVTTLRSMRGHPTHFTVRDRVRSGEIPGPRLVLASPGIAKEPNPTPEQARQLVRDYVEAGYDMIKVTEGFSPLAYRAIMAEARTLGIKVGGHLSSAIPVPMAIELQQSSVEHLHGYGLAYQKHPGKIEELAQRTREQGVFHCPTLDYFVTWMLVPDLEELERRRAAKVMPMQWVQEWREGYAKKLTATADDLAKKRRGVASRRALLKILADAGVKLMVSPSGGWYIAPGLGMVYEMELMVGVGISEYEVLVAATRNAALYLEAEGQRGTVAVGMDADLVLLGGNPLEKIEAAGDVRGVMVRGQYYSKEALDLKVADIAARHGH